MAVIAAVKMALTLMEIGHDQALAKLSLITFGQVAVDQLMPELASVHGLLTSLCNALSVTHCFCQPRVGNVAFQQLVDHLVPQFIRVVNEGDPVMTHTTYALG